MRIFKSFLILFFVALAALPQASAYAQTLNEKPDQLVHIRLLPERGQIKAGEELLIGIEQVITPDWHTYWKNPGDSGTETRIEWTLPDGFEVSEIQWPTPHKLPYGPLLNYGYEDNVVLMQKIIAPQNIPEGEITLSADIEVLVCKETCIPEYGTYTLKLNGAESDLEDNTAFLSFAQTRIPQHTDQSVSYHEAQNDFVLSLKMNEDEIMAIDPATLTFFPEDWGLIENTAPVRASFEDNIITLKQTRGERLLSEIKTSDGSIQGVLSYKTTSGKPKSYAFTAIKAPVSFGKAIHPNMGFTIAKAILFAIIGGLILNLMPCVFPVLSIKALSLVKIADKHPSLARLHGLSYTAGVVLSFTTIAAILLILKSIGMEIGWGFQLQNPTVIAFLTYLLFLIGLNLIGFFEIAARISNFGGRLTQNTSGPLNSFFTGILASIVAAPCTAPFMAAAIGFALTQPTFVNLAIFASLGLGLALPYLLLSFIPAFQHALPKPGAWMQTFKQFLSFPMFLSVIWLIWVLSQQSGPTGVLEILIGLATLTFAIWLLKHVPENKIAKPIVIIIAATSLAITAIMGIKSPAPNENRIIAEEAVERFGEVYTPEKLEALLAGDDPVFVEMTAAWCITCKANHAIAINTTHTRELFKNNNVRYLIGDWTNQDPTITQYLNQYERNGVPLYVYYAARNTQTGERPEPQILPQLLKPSIFNEYIQ